MRSARNPGRRSWFTILQSSFFILQFSILSYSYADDSPKHAERGVQAYQAGKYDLARLFFGRALQDAVLKGREEWAVMATLNLADLELEAMDEREAGRLLGTLNTHDPALRSLILWKRSQLAYQLKRHGEALGLVDSALLFVGKGKDREQEQARERALRIDRLRYLVASRPPAEWEKEYETFLLRLPAADRPRALTLEAGAAMARQRFARADTLWRDAMVYYRGQGRLAKVAACLNQAAICRFSLGRRAEALETNARAVTLYGELGLALPGLRAQALRLLLEDDDRELARIRQDMDVVGQRLSGFDLQGILDEYSHSLGGSPSLPPGP